MKMDIVGRRFGRLEVLERIDARDDRGEMPRPSYYSAYRCRCACGAQVRSTYYALYRGKTSCGCDRVPKQRNLAGRRFGSLTALRPVLEGGDGRMLRGDDALLRWECRCDCGVTVAVCGLQLAAGVIGSCGCVAPTPVRENSDINRVMRNNTTGVNGVTYADKSHTRYRVFIGFRGTDYDLGCYDTLDDAKTVRLRAEEMLYHPSPEDVTEVQSTEATVVDFSDRMARRMSRRSALRAAEKDYPLDADMLGFLNANAQARRMVWQMMTGTPMQPDDRKLVGARVRKTREKTGLSIRAFAEAAGLGKSYLTKVESGLSALSDEATKCIVDHFGQYCTREWLLYGIQHSEECPYSPEMNDWLKQSGELRKIVQLTHELADAPIRPRPQKKTTPKPPPSTYETWTEDDGDIDALGQPAWSARTYSQTNDWMNDFSDDVYMG